jgi:hypothetical protein
MVSYLVGRWFATGCKCEKQHALQYRFYLCATALSIIVQTVTIELASLLPGGFDGVEKTATASTFWRKT